MKYMPDVEFVINDGPDSFTLPPETFYQLAVMSVERSETINETIINALEQATKIDIKKESEARDKDNDVITSDDYEDMLSEKFVKELMDDPQESEHLEEIMRAIKAYKEGKCTPFSDKPKEPILTDSVMIDNLAEDIMKLTDKFESFQSRIVSLDGRYEEITNIVHNEWDDLQSQIISTEDSIEELQDSIKEIQEDL